MTQAETSASRLGSGCLARFLRAEATLDPRRAFAVAAVSGLSNALILAVVNSAAEHAEQSSSRPLYAVGFAAVMVLYVIAQRWILTQAAQQIEGIIHRVRMRLVRTLKDCELLDVEGLGRAVIYSGIARHTQTLSQSASTLTIAAQMAIMVVFASLYIAWISITSFIVLVVFMAIALTIYFRRSFSVQNNLQETLAMDNDVYGAVDDLLDGFKEAKLSRAKTAAILERVEQISGEAAGLRTHTQTQLAQNFVFSQTTFYLLLGVMVFIVPMFAEGYSDVVQKSTTAVLFIIGPISGIIGSMPIFENASAAAREIMTLEERLKKLAGLNGHGEPGSPLGATDITPGPSLNGKPVFDAIELKGAEFRFAAPADDPNGGFTIGPIDLMVSRGETLFITGGNGSGKSTLLRVLTGLYPVSRGQLYRDGRIVRTDRLQDHRELFSAVFSDFHLFRHLDAVAPEMMEEADDWLRLLEIDSKVMVRGGAFSTTDLSSGQRKRLALIGAVLENRPILVLDEWAADQDPMFRRKFYREILPRLKARGQTIIAVTHDSRFFDAADRQLHMEDGQIGAFDPEIFHD